MDSVRLVHNGTLQKGDWKYDPSGQTTGYYFYQADEGDYTLRGSDLFGKSYSISFHLHKDTSIFQEQVSGYTCVTALRPMDLLQPDTIRMVFASNGCFHSSRESLMWVHNRSKATCNLYYRNSRGSVLLHSDLPAAAAESVYELQQDFINLISDSTRGISTSQQSLFILAGHRLFYTHDPLGESSDIYHRFIAQWFKEQE